MICADNRTPLIVPKEPIVLLNKGHELPNYISMTESFPFL
jgi:hypothetical protein